MTDLHHNLIINLDTDTTSTLYLDVIANEVSTPLTYTLQNGKFTVPFSDFSVGDELTFMIRTPTDTPLWKTHEGVKILVDGEETDTTVNSSGQFSLTFKNHGEHDIQAVYLGNVYNDFAKTEKKHFQVKQPATISGDPENDGEYNIKFVQNSTPSLTYNDSSTIDYQLTKGGVPLANKIVQAVVPQGANISLKTNGQGIVTFTNNYSYDVGKYKIGAIFYNPSTNKIITSTFRDVEIKKGTATWTDNATDGSTFYVGGKYKATLKYRGTPITNTKVDLFVNGNKTTLTTSSTGMIVYYFKAQGTYDLKLVYKGDKNMNQVELAKKFTVTVQ